MKSIELACEKIELKLQTFLKYEKQTEQLLTCDIDDIEKYMEKRQDIISEVNKINSEIDLLLSGNENLFKAIKNSCNRNELPTEYLCVFDASQRIFAVVNRIAQIEPQAMARFEREKETLLVKIKENNQSVGAQASKYYNSAYQRQENNLYRNKI